MTDSIGTRTTRVQRPWALATTTYFGTMNSPSLAALFFSSRGGSPIAFIINAVLWFFLYLLA